jgi:hypothetical protein
MLEEVDFIAGDPGDLLGRCILFAQNEGGSENPFNPVYPALAIAPDPPELLEIISSIVPMTDEMRENLLSKLKESTEMWTRTMFGQDMHNAVKDMIENGMDRMDVPDELKEQLKAEMAHIPKEDSGVPFHGCYVPLVGFDPGVIETYTATCDVMQAPDVPNITYAGLVLAGHAQHYLAAYFMQQEEVFADEDDEDDEEDVHVPSSRDLPKQEFLALLDRKMSELMYAYETGDDPTPHLWYLRRLTSGTFFVKDIVNLSGLAETNHPDKIRLMEMYIKRIHLLAAERYEEITVLDQEIRHLTEQR